MINNTMNSSRLNDMKIYIRTSFMIGWWPSVENHFIQHSIVT